MSDGIDFQPLDSTTTNQIDFQPLDNSQQNQSVANTISDSVKQVINSPSTIAGYLTPQKLAPYLPVAGAMVGSAFAPGIGTAVGAGLGQIGSRMAQLAYGQAQPSDAQDPIKESIAPMVQTATQGLTEYPPIQKAVGAVANTVGNGASRIGEALSGVPAKDIKNLFNNPSTLFSVGSKSAAGEAVGEAQGLAGVNPGVTSDPSTMTPDNVEKALNISGTGKQALDSITQSGNGTPEQLGDALKYISDEIKGRLSQGKDASELINIQNHLNTMLDNAAPDVQAARQNYGTLAQRNKFLQLFPKNKNQTISKANLFYLSSLLGGLGETMGGATGAGEAITGGIIARAPITTGLVTSGLGAINSVVNNPTSRSAIISSILNRMYGPKSEDQSQGQ